jgi:hypothetical protein
MNMKKIILSLIIFLISVSGVRAEEPLSVSNSLADSDALSSSINVLEQNYEAAKTVPYMPGTVTGPVVSPSLFNIVGRPAGITGLPLWTQFSFIPKKHDRATGKSGGTNIVYNGIDPVKPVKNGNTSVSLNVTGRASGTLAGSLTIESKKNHANSVDIPTIMHDAAAYVENIDNLKGCSVTLLTVPEAISFTLGVDSKSRGFSLAPVLSRFFEGAMLLTGLSGGVSSTGGVTVPTGTVGCTFLVIVESTDQHSIDLTNTYRNYVARVSGQPISQEGGEQDNGTKKARQAESTKK